MINKRRITEASSFYAKETWNHEEDQFVCMDSFKAGAEWAQEEFVENLWHDVEEDPQRYDDYLVKTKQGCIDFCHFNINGWHNPKVGGGNVSKWLDLKYIQPTGGNNENTVL